ncbi:DUF4817 domain-containing protein [Camponotus japonicus]
MGYTAEEYTDMIICYGMAGENASAAMRLYAERFPNRERHPSNKTVLSCIQRARETGLLVTHKRQIDVPLHHHAYSRIDEKVLRALEEKPRNICRIARTLGIGRSTVYRILEENDLHPVTSDSDSE